MSDPVEAAISDALLGHLDALVLDPPLTVALPGIGFTPPSGTYLEAQLIWNSNRTRFVGDTAANEFRGILQVTVATTPGRGLKGALSIASKVADHFERGTRLFAAGVKIAFDGRPSIASPHVGADRLRVPVSVSFYVFA